MKLRYLVLATLVAITACAQSPTASTGRRSPSQAQMAVGDSVTTTASSGGAIGSGH